MVQPYMLFCPGVLRLPCCIMGLQVCCQGWVTRAVRGSVWAPTRACLSTQPHLTHFLHGSQTPGGEPRLAISHLIEGRVSHHLAPDTPPPPSPSSPPGDRGDTLRRKNQRSPISSPRTLVTAGLGAYPMGLCSFKSPTVGTTP